MGNSPFEDRPTSLGGYGSIVPYHAPMTYDPLRGDEGVVVHFPTEGYESPDQILDRLTRASQMIGVSTEPGSLYYTAICKDFSWYGTGVENLQSDLQSSWELSEALRDTLEERHNSDLEIHRPCFVILAPTRYGIFWSTLRGFKDRDEDGEDYETVYDSQAGVLMENLVLSWPALEDLVDSDGPIPLVTTDVETANRSGNDRPLEEVVPVNHEKTGDADILAAKTSMRVRRGTPAKKFGRQSIEPTVLLTELMAEQLDSRMNGNSELKDFRCFVQRISPSEDGQLWLDHRPVRPSLTVNPISGSWHHFQ